MGDAIKNIYHKSKKKTIEKKRKKKYSFKKLKTYNSPNNRATERILRRAIQVKQTNDTQEIETKT